MAAIMNCHTRDHHWYSDATAREVARFAQVIDGGDLGTAVPTCPDWTLKDLVEHIGGIHRWAAEMVRTLAPERLRRGPESGISDYHVWLADGGPMLQEAFAGADPDAPMWAWGADKHARFWSRRMLFETMIHRADAELALGVTPEIPTEDAADGIDEFLDNLAAAASFSPTIANLKGAGEVVGLSTPETQWAITLSPDGFTWSHAVDANPSASITATGPDLLLHIYGRSGNVKTDGDQALLKRWRENARI
jgi:uncharacterized protein (TIGR03083 family)